MRITTGMEINSQRTISPDIFSNGMVQCVLGVSLHNSEAARKHAFVKTGNWALMAKHVFSTFISWIIPASNLPEKRTGSFFSSWQQQFWLSFWVFQKKHAACHFLLGGCLTVQNYLIRVTTDKAVNTHRTLPWQPFSWNGPMCHRYVFTLLWNSQESCFCEPGN